MPQYTVLIREDLMRAESDPETIERFKRCGYAVKGAFEATTAGGALGQYREKHPKPVREEKAPMSAKMRYFLIGGAVATVLWLCFLAFGLLPMAL
ncbi:hypothetical protein ACFQ45_04965 [Rhodanobacter aciditrophus]|uniref:Uncharacterized protein n=1 Tax=Rhodanobacter aciditrophus TaxID=1623218 RepID=A0ABW4AYI2_9GAMM